MKQLFQHAVIGFWLCVACIAVGVEPAPPVSAPVSTPAGVRVIDLEPVWAGHPVGFALLTAGQEQFAAYYDARRQITVAQRSLGSVTWKFKKLPNSTQWDSHNYLTLALDSANCLHLSGNMHVVPLIYFRSTKPLDIESLEQVKSMVGPEEDRVTYPKFQKDPAGRLIFSYRSGRSGQGNTIFNVYDTASRSWSRLLEKPLFDGEGKRNAYMACFDPAPGTAGYYHMVWVWRNSPDASTNHDLSYMRSRDLQHWETIEGKPLALPVTLETPGVIVDPIPVKGGTLNGAGQVGFGPGNELIISYYKFDSAGKTQLYFARFENGAWKSYQGSDWDYRWEPGGGGSLAAEVHVGPVRMIREKMTIAVSHKKYGGGLWEIDPATFKLKGKLGHDFETSTVPAEPGRVRSTFAGMQVRWAGDSNPATQEQYRLRWETLGPNRDHPRPAPWPEPTMLQLIELPRK